MFQKSLQNSQMDLPAVTARLSYAPESALLQMDPLEIFLQVASSAYPTDIPDYNYYLLYYYELLFHKIIGLLKYHSISPVALTYLSPVPTVFKHSYQKPFRKKGLPQFQIPPTGTLQVTYPQPFHINFSQIPHIRRLYQIHPLLPVNIKVLRPPYLRPHPQGWHLLHPHKSHLIRFPLILHYPQVCFFMQLKIWCPTLLHKDLVVCLLQFLMKHPVDHHLQALHPQVCHPYHPQKIHLIKLTLLFHHP